MMLLALDTSGDVVAAALHDGASVVGTRAASAPSAHGETLAPLLQELFAASGCMPTRVTQIVVGVGPGPYTGLRVGIATARTIGFAIGAPVQGICSLDAIAWAASLGGAESLGSDASLGTDMLVTTDARRNEVYFALYNSSAQRVSGPEVARPDALPHEVRALATIGPGALKYADKFGDVRGTSPIDAGAMASLAIARPEVLLDPVPLYLRRPDAVGLSRG